jgi:hypothetical protein
MTAPSIDYILVRRKGFVQIPEEDLLLVRRQDLERIKEQITNAELNSPPGYLQNLAFSIISVAAGIACNIPQVAMSTPLSSWVLPLYVVVPVALAVMGAILFSMDRNLRKSHAANRITISQEIQKLLDRAGNDGTTGDHAAEGQAGSGSAGGGDGCAT